ncbi:hypothetical protein H6G98_24405 [Nostoc sp. FACHB-857]|nr:hypothetical protein [Nostoc sp. FACHB-857]
MWGVWGERELMLPHPPTPPTPPTLTVCPMPNAPSELHNRNTRQTMFEAAENFPRNSV